MTIAHKMITAITPAHKKGDKIMKITRDTDSYNERRHGKPWIAKITLVGNDLKFHFGAWLGDKGEEGILILDEIEVGEFYAIGRKDFRQPRNSKPNYYQLGGDGQGIETTKPNIYKALAT